MILHAFLTIVGSRRGSRTFSLRDQRGLDATRAKRGQRFPSIPPIGGTTTYGVISPVMAASLPYRSSPSNGGGEASTSRRTINGGAFGQVDVDVRALIEHRRRCPKSIEHPGAHKRSPRSAIPSHHFLDVAGHGRTTNTCWRHHASIVGGSPPAGVGRGLRYQTNLRFGFQFRHAAYRYRRRDTGPATLH